MNLFTSFFLFIFQLLQKLRELQHEVLLLSHLKHPCIISLVGFILRPLCLVLELAPMRSLRLVINSHMNKHNKQEILFPKMLTYRILLQVIAPPISFVRFIFVCSYRFARLYILSVILRRVIIPRGIWTMQPIFLCYSCSCNVLVDKFYSLLQKIGTPFFPLMQDVVIITTKSECK